jgi:hypothetical protein
MSRPRRAPSSPVQLFPFLAVLVSAIGALVLLLLAINRQATMQAIARAVGLLAQQTSSEEEAMALRSHELESQVIALRERILQLGNQQKGIEESLVATDRKAHQHAARAESLRGELAGIRARRAEVERDRETVERQIALGEAAKARLAAERSNPDRTFVPIVHPGANGTDRQPIYIECSGESVTIWPEKVVVPTAALNSSEYARAALARTIRVLGQYYLDRDSHTEPGVTKRLEPYPLLLVRPDGVDAYYAVCEALVRQRGFLFGYELIEADWSLRFPDPDPRARDVAIAELRKTSLGVRLADSDAGRSRRGIGPNKATGSGSPDDEPGGNYRSSNNQARESSAPTGESGDRPLPGSPMADGSRLYSDESVFSRLAGGPRAQTPPGTAAAQRLAGRRQADEAAQPPEQEQDSQRASSAHQRVERDPTTDSEREPTLQLTNRSSTTRRSIDVDEPTDGDSPADRLAGNPRGAGRITVPRRIEAICRADRLVVTARQTVIELPRTGSFHEGIATLREEIDREVAAWGPPGKFFEWEPQLFCRVHADAIDTYYRLRLEMAGSSIAFDHEIMIEQDFEFGTDSRLGEALSPTINLDQIWE